MTRKSYQKSKHIPGVAAVISLHKKSIPPWESFKLLKVEKGWKSLNYNIRAKFHADLGITDFNNSSFTLASCFLLWYKAPLFDFWVELAGLTFQLLILEILLLVDWRPFINNLLWTMQVSIGFLSFRLKQIEFFVFSYSVMCVFV